MHSNRLDLVALAEHWTSKPKVAGSILTVVNLKEAFRFNNERDIAYNLRSRETDLALPLPKKRIRQEALHL